MSYHGEAYDLPAVIAAGGSWRSEALGLRVNVDAEAPQHYVRNVRIGAEWRPVDLIALRAGYRRQVGESGLETLTGPSFGLGTTVTGLGIDYAFIPGAREANGEHRIGLTWRPHASEAPRAPRVRHVRPAVETWKVAPPVTPPASKREVAPGERAREVPPGDLAVENRLRDPLARDRVDPRRFADAFARAGDGAGLDPALLLAVARQESRFTPAVSSAVGAVGLLQLMPETAADLEGTPQATAALQDPDHNAALGARYLRQLLDRWRGNPFLAVASYNAGSGTVQGWLGAGAPDVQREAELWTEAIPYPETRLYTKKVLGNYWTYRQEEGRPPC